MPDSCRFNGDANALEIYANIIGGDSRFDLGNITWDDSKFALPADLINSWSKKSEPVTIEEFTSRKAFGSGIFDAFMEAVYNHLKIEYDKGRITGAEYANAFVKLTEAALGNAVQFALQKDQAYYSGMLAQAQAITAGINAQIAAITAKVQFYKLKAEALSVGAQYALTTMKLATEDAQFSLTCKQQAVANAEIALRTAQAKGEEASTLLKEYQATMSNPSPTGEDVGKNVAYLATVAEKNLKEYQAEAQNYKAPLNPEAPSNIDYYNKLLQMQRTKQQLAANEPLQKQTDPVTGETKWVDPETGLETHDSIDFLIKAATLEQNKAQVGVTDAQAALYKQQKISYIRQDEKNVAEVFSNAYMSMKAIDEGLSIPKAFSGGSINEVLQTLKANVELGRDNTNISTYKINDDTIFTGNSDIDVKEEGQKPVLDKDKIYADKAFDQNGVLKGEEEEEEETEGNG